MLYLWGHHVGYLRDRVLASTKSGRFIASLDLHYVSARKTNKLKEKWCKSMQHFVASHSSVSRASNLGGATWESLSLVNLWTHLFDP